MRSPVAPAFVITGETREGEVKEMKEEAGGGEEREVDLADGSTSQDRLRPTSTCIHIQSDVCLRAESSRDEDSINEARTRRT